MPSFPIIDSSCPFRADEAPQPGCDHCGHCDRKVHNLDGMSDEQRRAFLAGCSGKVCVAYTVNRSAQRRNVALGAGLAISLAGSGATMAQSAPIVLPPDAPTPSSPAVEPVEGTTILTEEQIAAMKIPDGLVLLMGGVLDPTSARWSDESDIPTESAALPEIDALEWLPSKPED